MERDLSTLPPLTEPQVKELVRLIRENLNYDAINWDDMCCTSESIDDGVNLTISTLEALYGLREFPKPYGEEDEEEE